MVILSIAEIRREEKGWMWACMHERNSLVLIMYIGMFAAASILLASLQSPYPV